MRGLQLRGDPSVAADTISGVAVTGDIIGVALATAGLPRPEEVDPARFWNVPRPPSRVFVGRDRVLEAIAQTLAFETNGVAALTVTGLGGVGKTEVAVRYAYTYQHRYSGVWWISADSGANMTAGLAALAHRLAPATTSLSDEQGEAWALAWLRHHRNWLIVLDNVNDPTDVEGILDVGDGGHVLVTSRLDLGWTDSRPQASIRLKTLTTVDAVRLLTERTGQHDETAATEIATLLGELPLALEQASAYITYRGLTLAAYRDLLRDRSGEFRTQGKLGLDPERPVGRVWAVAFDSLSATHPVAVEILHVLAWLDPEDVPRDLITALTNGDQVAAEGALSQLASFGMVMLTSDTVSTHRLVQEVLRTSDSATKSELRPHQQAIRLLSDATPSAPDNVADWPRWRALLPHITALAEHLPDSTDTALGRLLHLAALFEASQGLYGQAAAHAAQALAITESALGRDHPSVAIRLGNLANRYSELGRLGEAVTLLERAVLIAEAALGPDQATVATYLGNLATGYSAVGRLGDAVTLFRRALAITEAALGPNHPSVATHLGNLATSYRTLGRSREAIPLFQRALAITEVALGPNHPSVATHLGNLATSYRTLGHSREAIPLFQRALAITEAALGPNHPSVATHLGNLATTQRDLGRAAEAVPLLERALAITEAALGPHHPDVATHLGNLATSYVNLGRAAEAVPLLERALAITEAALGPHHPSVAIHLGNLASSYVNLGRAAEAVPLLERALAITETALGPDHPDVATRLSNLAGSYLDLGRAAEAVPLLERALAITETALDPDHPEVATHLGNLATSYLNLGRAAEAVPLLERALAITETALGPDHPEVATRLSNLAGSYLNLGRAANAVPLLERALAITETTLGPDHPDVAIHLTNLATSYRAVRRRTEVIPLFERALGIAAAALGPAHPTSRRIRELSQRSDKRIARLSPEAEHRDG
ncbi:FxSxx-COOH system tetratricopeptide repeat protein [Micromonospora orduensis]|uniref:FxSxx-COOH system tetratricopeptide repeat protein n=1 Tax=Micromonospora orduensis TaxID=1420891 RepID=UPI0037F2B990